MLRPRTWILTLAILSSSFVLAASPAAANRFGPPWMARVVTDQATVYANADLSSQTAGTLQHGAIVVVLGEQTDSSSHEWTQTTLGFVPSEAVVEEINSWVADVTAPNAAVYAKPNANDAIRLSVHKGDLLRVTGVSAGMQGDKHIWWSTTEGY